MQKDATHQSIYAQTESGLLVKTGNTSAFSSRDSSSYLTLKERGLDLRELYRKNGLEINSTSGLAHLIDDTSKLSDAWLCNENPAVTNDYLLSATQLDRIATAAVPLGVSAQAKAFLTEMLSGSLDLLSRKQSKAKNTLWELELWHMLAKFGMSVTLEEPDLVVSFDGAKIGIACKKFYSENNVSKVLSEAVSQIEDGFSFGVVALNLDDLTPPNIIYEFKSLDQALEKISRLNFAFLKRHERHFRKYLQSGRVVAALVSTSVIVHVPTTGPRLFNARQSTVWKIPGLRPQKEQQFRNFFKAVSAAHE